MSAKRYKLRTKEMKRPKPLLESFALLFYISKVVGIKSQNWCEFLRFKRLKRSYIGDGVFIIGIIISFINYNIMIVVFQIDSYAIFHTPLIALVGMVFSYCQLIEQMSDMISALLKQKDFLNVFNVLQDIDEDLWDISIKINNNFIKYYLLSGILLAAFVDILVFSCIILWYVDRSVSTAWLWIYFIIPTFLNTLDKLWYLGILMAIKARFQAINNALDKEALNLNLKQENLKAKQTNKFKKTIFKNQVTPVAQYETLVFGEAVTNLFAFAKTLEQNSATNFPLPIINTKAAMESKFFKYCQLHDTLCNVANQLNNVYAFPNFVLLGCSFLLITSQLYFCYCTNMGQEIPSMFRLTKSYAITALSCFYISYKCISILYVNTLTSLESKKTGVVLHRCGLAADNNETYEMINHLSLKIFNHQLNFNACGYFPLDMTTLFSFCGGITTYLIILIQFNLEEHQAKFKTEIGTPMALVHNGTYCCNEQNVVNGTHSQNLTAFLNEFF